MLDRIERAGSALSQEQADAYWEDGNLSPLRAMPAEEAAALRPDVCKTGGERDAANPACGQDLHGLFESTPEPTAPFQPANLAAYDRLRALQSDVMMKGAKGSSSFYGKAKN